MSLRIRALEDRVGLPLIRRGKPCVGTEAGNRLCRHAEDVALLEHQALRDLDLAGDTGPTRVSLAINADSLATWFPSILNTLEGLLLDVKIDDQDYSVDWLTRGDVVAAVTGTDKAASGCDVTPLGAIRYVATASPDFVERWFSNGVTVEALSKAPGFAFDAKDNLQARWMTAKTGRKLFPPSHMLPSTHGFIAAAQSGGGWGMNPLSLVEPYLKSGALVAIDPDLPLDVPHYWQIGRRMKPALHHLDKAVRAAAKRQLYQE